MATAISATGGYLLGRAYLVRKAEIGLGADATQIQERAEEVRAEVYSMLAVLKAANLPACSEGELAHFRELVYHSVNIRDVGRMRDGRLECSADFGRGTMPEIQFQPSNKLADGLEIYLNLPPFLYDNELAILFLRGGFFVAEDPNTIIRWRRINRNYETYTWSYPGNIWRRVSGLPPRISTGIADHEGRGRVGDTLYATHCSIKRSSCAVAYGSLSDVLQADRPIPILCTALGALFGAFVMLVYLLIHQHSQSLANQLLRAIRQGKLRLEYQPIVDLHCGRVVGAEALARWTDEEGYTVSPEVFVRVAEERGFVGELTELVVRHALRDFRKLQRNDPNFRLNINITASDLIDERFLPMLERSLAAAGVAPQGLAIEVTEGSTASKQMAINAIRSLRERGHFVEIDDFGTGYSSLAYLKDLAVNAIKIDRAFVQAIGTGAVIGGILSQILVMAETLQLEVVIEGIETEEQLKFFADSRMPLVGQGFLLGRPVPVDEFSANEPCVKMKGMQPPGKVEPESVLPAS
jgi:sensor c-di-GMP phosphodiesterase-like protein